MIPQFFSFQFQEHQKFPKDYEKRENFKSAKAFH